MALLFRSISPSPLSLRSSSSSSRLSSLRPLNSSSFDPVKFEAERLRLDEQARSSMASASEADSLSEDKQWKWRIRKRVWDMMEKEGIARNPRPVHHRIPNFDGAASAAETLAQLEVFQKSSCVKVNPDSPQKQVRFLTLTGGKKLLTPQPRLRTGFFSVLEAPAVPAGAILEACTSVGAAKYGKPINLDEKIKVDLIVIGSVAVDPVTGARLGKGEAPSVPAGAILEACTSVGAAKYGKAINLDEKIKVDLIVIGSVAVDLKSGARLGKGEGFAELEYGMLRYMGSIDDSTMVVTTVHDRQLVDGIPAEKLLIHDVPVDIICTPTRIIFTNTKIPKPQGIYWEKLSPEKLGQIRILRELKRRIERETGTKLPCGPSEKLPPTAQRRKR